ncbi:ABC-three component system middle component 2 [Nocardia vinacea]|uniref:ABC-three component system middle component 2 n=1 Tax=Nocardia vinacea TaxID=96468 RepID=UPI000A05C9E3|nr:ABC-three component system middle component 2 [Nocardia vinacea]
MTTPPVLVAEVPDRPPVVVPEDDVVFRLAQLLLLLASLQRMREPGIALERLGCYDFLVANPLLVLTDEKDMDRKRLLLAGFDGRALNYASPAHRFTTRRERLQHDLALLIAYGLVTPTVDKSIFYTITPSGIDLAGKFTAVYARSYCLSVDIIVRRLERLSDKRLREAVHTWTTVECDTPRPEMLNLLDTVVLLHNPSAIDGLPGVGAASSTDDGLPI